MKLEKNSSVPVSKFCSSSANPAPQRVKNIPTQRGGGRRDKIVNIISQNDHPTLALQKN